MVCLVGLVFCVGEVFFVCLFFVAVVIVFQDLNFFVACLVF